MAKDVSDSAGRPAALNFSGSCADVNDHAPLDARAASEAGQTPHHALHIAFRQAFHHFLHLDMLL